MPAASTAVAWTNTSLAPPSGEINPKPFDELKNFTVPVAMIAPHAVFSARHHAVRCFGSWLRKGLSRPGAQFRRVGATVALLRTDAVAGVEYRAKASVPLVPKH